MPTSLAALVGGAVAWPPGPSNPSLKKLKNLSPEDIHVLLVDDERLSRLVVGNLLRKCNYRGTASCLHQFRSTCVPSRLHPYPVTPAGSGIEALEILRNSEPGTFQLVLTVRPDTAREVQLKSCSVPMLVEFPESASSSQRAVNMLRHPLLACVCSRPSLTHETS